MEQRNKLQVLAPVLHAAGPGLPRPGPRQGGWDQAACDAGQIEVCEALFDVLENFAANLYGIGEFVLRVWQAFQQSVVHPDEMPQLLAQCVESYSMDLDSDDVEDYNLLRAFDNMMGEVADQWGCSWLLGHLQQEQDVAVAGKGEFDEIEEFKKLLRSPVPSQPVPRPIKLRCLSE